MNSIIGNLREQAGRLPQKTKELIQSLIGGLRAARASRIFALTLFVAISCAITVFAVGNTRVVTVTDGSKVHVIRTSRATVDDILAQVGVELGHYDSVKVEGDNRLALDLDVRRAFPVYLVCDNKTSRLYFTEGKVRDLLEKSDIELGVYDIINHQLEDALYSDMLVMVNRVEYMEITDDILIPFATSYQPSKTIPRGSVVEISSGVEGVARSVLEYKYVDGKLESTTVKEQEIISEPVAAVVQRGVGGEYDAPTGVTLSYSFYRDMTATAYTYGENGKWGDVTATGKPVQVGYVAVDPRVIPYGSKLYIIYPNGTVAYGFAVAEDTGGGIKGNRIDLFFETHDEAISFGRRTVRVYVLDE